MYGVGHIFQIVYLIHCSKTKDGQYDIKKNIESTCKVMVALPNYGMF